MKHIAYKITAIFCSIICFGMAMVACQDDEELNLLGYPENPISVNPEKGDNMNISATYDTQGKLVLSSSLNRTWRISLATPSPEDASIKIAPLLVNIPADKVTLDTEIINLPAGSLYQDVTLGINEEDLAFMEDNLQAEVYELGVTVSDANGLKLNTDSSLGKLVVEKEKYSANVSMIASQGPTEFKKIYFNKELLGDPISYSFKLQLDKPAIEDLEIKLMSEGVPADFVSSSQFTPSTVKIPAGSKESEDIIWNITDDFLKTTEEDMSFDIALKAVVDNEFATMVSQNSQINLRVLKTSNILELSTYKPYEWREVDNKSRWGITLESPWKGNASCLIDGTRYEVVSMNVEEGEIGELVVDLLSTHSLVGIGIAFGVHYYPVWEVCAATESEWLVSTDKANWISLGSVKNTLGGNDRHYYHLGVPVEARYVKYRGKLDAQIGKLELNELYMFKTKE